jgi:hypothetical protein
MASAVAVGTPRNVSDLGVTGVARTAWEKRMVEDIVRGSIFRKITTSYKINRLKEINVDKLGCFMQLPAGAGGPSNSVVMTMALPLKEAPVVGRDGVLIGNEEDRELRYMTAYYAEHKKGVKQTEYGTSFNETAYLDLNSGNPQALKRWHEEYFDLRCHQTLLMRYEDALIGAPASRSQTMNPHILIPNRLTPRVLWDKDAPTRTAGAADSNGWYSAESYSGVTSYVEAFVDALMDASGTGSTSKCLPNTDLWAMIKWYTENEMLMEPVMLDGRPTILLLCPPHIIDWAMNENNTGSIFKSLEKTEGYIDKAERSCFPGEVGRIKDTLLLIRDERYTTVTISGSDGSWVVTPGYMYPGNYDMRNKSAWSNTSGSTNYSFDNILGLGGNALVEYLVDPLNTNLSEYYNYKQIKGLGSYLGSGMQVASWDKDAASATDGASTTLVHRGSFVCPVGRVSPFAVT